MGTCRVWGRSTASKGNTLKVTWGIKGKNTSKELWGPLKLVLTTRKVNISFIILEAWAEE